MPTAAKKARQGCIRFRRHPIPKNVDPIITFIFEEMNRQQVTKGELAKRAGIAETVLYSWKTKSIPHLDTLRAVLMALGFNLKLYEMQE